MRDKGSANSRFDYLYRDASNYKAWGSVVFAGRVTDDLERRLARSLESHEFFVAHQVRVPETFSGMLLWPREQEDHCWHEFSQIQSTAETPTDAYGRTIDEFVAEVEQQSLRGWEVFDPMHYRISGQSL